MRNSDFDYRNKKTLFQEVKSYDLAELKNLVFSQGNVPYVSLSFKRYNLTFFIYFKSYFNLNLLI